MKKLCFLIALTSLQAVAFAQDERDEDKPSFSENLFTGGSVSLAFYNNTFLVGASPVLGYSVTNWADAGFVVNYNYTSYRDYNFEFNAKLRQHVYGGGAFVKLYPVRFLFAQAQVEHNYLRQKYLGGTSDVVQRAKGEANSVLVGGGYTNGREGRGGNVFYYLSVLFDVGGDALSPYTDSYGRTIPIVRAGLQIPLGQGR